MLDETIIKLLEPTLEKLVAERVTRELQSQLECLELGMSEACKLTGLSRATLKDILYRNRKEVEDFVFFGDGQKWRILKKPFSEWWVENFDKTFIGG